MAAMKQEVVEVIYPEHTERRNPPINLVREDLGLFQHELCRQIPATTLRILHNADVLTDNVISRKERRFYSEHTLVFKPTLRQKIKRLLLYATPYDRLDKGVWIIDNWSAGYFHWFTDALPRLMAVESFMDNHCILLPADFKTCPYIVASLDLLNVPVKFFDKKRRLNVGELILPGYTAKTGNYNKEFIQKVRRKFTSSKTVHAGKRIYISRNNAAKRKVLNEAEVIATVKEYGFEICIFEEMSFLQQVHLMQETDILLGIHGAGLTNMLFMPERGKILELRNQSDARNNCYFSLASVLGHSYYYLVGQGDSPDTHVVNLTVDVARLKALLKGLEQD